MNNLIKIAVALAFFAISTRNLPWVIYQIRKAQVHLIREYQASKWPKAMTVTNR
jgi:hypothetical protein